MKSCTRHVTHRAQFCDAYLKSRFLCFIQSLSIFPKCWTKRVTKLWPEICC